VGFNGLAGTGSVSGGVSWSETWRTSIPDLSIVNNSLSAGDNAEWEYVVAWPHVHSDYLNTNNRRMAIDDVPTIGTTTISVNNTWIWTVNNPKSYTGNIKVYSQIWPRYGYTQARQSWIGQEYSNSYASGIFYGSTFDLTPPNRVR
jgi:hypothetical protein